MYLWNVKALAEDLKEDRVTEKEQMKYYLLFCLLWTLAAIPSHEPSIWYSSSIEWSSRGTGIALLLVGIIWCYKANQQGDGKYFVVRALCLGLPIGIRVFIVGIIAATIEIIFFNLRNSVAHDLFLFGMYLVITVANYVILRNYLLYVSGAESK